MWAPAERQGNQGAGKPGEGPGATHHGEGCQHRRDEVRSGDHEPARAPVERQGRGHELEEDLAAEVDRREDPAQQRRRPLHRRALCLAAGVCTRGQREVRALRGEEHARRQPAHRRAAGRGDPGAGAPDLRHEEGADVHAEGQRRVDERALGPAALDMRPGEEQRGADVEEVQRGVRDVAETGTEVGGGEHQHRHDARVVQREVQRHEREVAQQLLPPLLLDCSGSGSGRSSGSVALRGAAAGGAAVAVHIYRRATNSGSAAPAAATPASAAPAAAPRQSATVRPRMRQLLVRGSSCRSAAALSTFEACTPALCVGPCACLECHETFARPATFLPGASGPPAAATPQHAHLR